MMFLGDCNCYLAREPPQDFCKFVKAHFVGGVLQAVCIAAAPPIVPGHLGTMFTDLAGANKNGVYILSPVQCGVQ
jgi:hypothetical protein